MEKTLTTLPGTKWRHKKRGTVYEILDEGRFQSIDGVYDDATVVIYVDAEGNVWVRPWSEFIDGRFERVE